MWYTYLRRNAVSFNKEYRIPPNTESSEVIMAESKPISRHNAEFDFWKFIASIIIVLHHSYFLFDNQRIYFGTGSVFVEYYFIVSGFFFAQSMLKKNRPYDRAAIGRESTAFILHKIKGLYSYFIFSFICVFAARVALNTNPDGLKLDNLCNSVFDFLFLSQAGLPGSGLVPGDVYWYLSAMMIALFILYPVFRWNSDLFIRYISPIAAIFLYGFFAVHDGQIGDPHKWYGFIYKGLLRGVAGICLGSAMYGLSVYLSEKIQTKAGKHLMSAVAFIGFICPAVLTYNSLGGKDLTGLHSFMILLFALSAAATGSRTSSVNALFDRISFIPLGKLSTAVYLCHPAAILALQYMADISNRTEALSFLRLSGNGLSAAALVILSVILGSICVTFCDSVKKILQKKKNQYIVRV